MPGLDPLLSDTDAWATGANQALNAVNDGFTPDQTLNTTTGVLTTRATFASATTFTVPGDATAFYPVGRRLKIVHGGGTTYCEVASSAFVTVTTVTIGTVTSGPATMTSPITSVAVGITTPGATGNRPNHANLGGLTADQHHAQLHAAAHQPGGGDAMAVDALAATGSLRSLGVGALQAAAGNRWQALDKKVTTTTVENTALETDLYRFTVPANTLGANGLLRLTLAGTYRDESGAGSTFTLRLKFGATTVLVTAALAPTWGLTPNTAKWRLLLLLMNAAATNAQRMSAQMQMSGFSGNSFDATAAQFGPITGHGTAAEDTTLAKDIACTVQMAAAALTRGFNVEQGLLEAAA